MGCGRCGEPAAAVSGVMVVTLGPDRDTTPGARPLRSTGMTMHTGALTAGDLVQLTDQKGRMHTISLEPGRTFHTHRGYLAHDALIGQPEGCTVQSSTGATYLALRPLLADYTLSMKRGATVIYPKDAAAIVSVVDAFPGASVLEAGAGSGALSMSLLRAIGPSGSLVSYERRADFAAIAHTNVTGYLGETPTWDLRVGDLVEGIGAGEVESETIDRMVLDMLDPWTCVAPAAQVLRPGGVLCVYVATTTQMSTVVEALRSHGGFTEPQSSELIRRTWHVEGLAVRPDHRMIGHTGFLVVTRRIAPGFLAPRRTRRPAPSGPGAADPGST
jgi:tRNA (adenine57-N1/adenine58-N1)-methyltransferase